jgi:hypothetical protein
VEQSNDNITEQSNSSWGAHQVFLFLAKFRHFLTKKLRKFSFRKILFFKCKFDYFCYFLVKFHQNFDTQKNEKKVLEGYYIIIPKRKRKTIFASYCDNIMNHGQKEIFFLNYSMFNISCLTY